MNENWVLEVDGAKIDECLERLINVENKIDMLIYGAGEGDNVGHPDQEFGGRTYAQHGDDLIVACIFHSIGLARPTYLDIGAHHPKNISNTALFYKRGSRGINVEPNPNLFEKFVEARHDDINLNVGVAQSSGVLNFYMIDEFSGRNTFSLEAAQAFVRDNPQFSIRETLEIPVVTINEIVNIYSNGIYPDFLSLDVEGFDEQIIESADFSRSQPKVICIEIDNSCGNSAAGRIKSLIESRGYECIIRAVSNLIFVDSRYSDKVR